MPLIIYAAPTQITPAHQPVVVRINRKHRILWIRVEPVESTLIDALAHAKPLDGETVCNSIPNEYAA